MKLINKISAVALASTLLLSGIVIAGGGLTHINSALPVVTFSADDEPLEFDENGVVINLGYPNVLPDVPAEVTLTPRDAQLALNSILKVMPKLSNGKNLGFLHHMPIDQRTSAHVVAGAFIATEDKQVDPMLQFGVTHKLTPNLSVTGELQRYFRPEEEDLQRYAVGLVYNF